MTAPATTERDAHLLAHRRCSADGKTTYLPQLTRYSLGQGVLDFDSFVTEDSLFRAIRFLEDGVPLVIQGDSTGSVHGDSPLRRVFDGAIRGKGGSRMTGDELVSFVDGFLVQDEVSPGHLLKVGVAWNACVLNRASVNTK